MPSPVVEFMALVAGDQYFQQGTASFSRTLTADKSVTFYATLSNNGSPAPSGVTAYILNTASGNPVVQPIYTSVSASNRLPYSNSMSGWKFDTFNSTQVAVTLNASTAPDASATMTRLDWNGPFNGSGAYADIEFQSTDGQNYANQQFSFSFWATSVSGSPVSLSVILSDWPWNGLSGGTAVIPVGGSGTGYRYQMTGIFPSGYSSFRPIIRFYGPSAASIYIWGMQMEVFNRSTGIPFPGPLIPTSGASAAGQGGLATATTFLGPVGTYNLAMVVGPIPPTNVTARSSIQTFTVTAATPTIALSIPSGTIAGQSISVAVNLSTCYQYTGLVTLKDASTGAVLGTGNATQTSTNTSSITFTVTNGNVGSRTFNVTTAANANNNASSGSGTYTIGQATPTITASVLTPVLIGTSLNLIANVSGYNASGTVQFYMDGSPYGTAATLSGGVAAQLAIPNNGPVGSHTITATYSGDSNNKSVTSSAQPVTITKYVTGVVLVAPNPNPPLAGQNFTLQAALPASYSATGSITFSYGQAQAGSTVIGTVALSSASVPNYGTSPQATITANLPAGSYTIWAAYSGDTNNAASVISSTVNVSHQNVTLNLAVSPSSVVVQGAVTLTATITGGDVPTGTISFLDGSTQIGNAQLVNGRAAITVSSLTPGTHSLSAQYSGDSNNNPATYSNVSEVILKATPVMTLTSPNSTAVGQPVTVLAKLTGGYSPTGTVTFSATDVPSTVVTVDPGGNAQLTVALSNTETETITAGYSGDANNVSVTRTITFAVTQAVPVLLLESSLSAVQAGQAITLTALPSSGFAVTGTVTFTMDGQTLGTVAIRNSIASIVTPPLPSGTRSFAAAYSGDARNASAVGTLSIDVSIATPSINLSILNTALTAGEGANLTATIVGGDAPSGTVTLFLDGVAFATDNLVNETVSALSPALTHGSHTLFAEYSGDQENLQATSPTLTVMVEIAPGVVINPSYPNRIELRLGSYQGPLATATGTVFNPSRDLEVFADGAAIHIQSWSYDPAANRYLMFFASTIASTSLVQVTHHMPASPFETTANVVLPGFSRVAMVSTAVDFVIPAVSLNVSADVVHGDSVPLVWSADGVAQFEVTATGGYDSTVLSASAGSGVLFTTFTTPGTVTLTINGLDTLGNQVYFAGVAVTYQVTITVT